MSAKDTRQTQNVASHASVSNATTPATCRFRSRRGIREVLDKNYYLDS